MCIRDSQESWEIKLVRILKYFKGDAKIWADAHNDNWVDFNEFEQAFKNKYWSEEKQEGLRSTIMGLGNFNIKNMSITSYVTRLYSQVKYLEPPMPLSSFIRYISKHLPKDIWSTIRTREFINIAELEKILEAYQSMKEEEDNKYQFRVSESNQTNTEIRQPDHFISNVSRSGAVSYTHLDVYKRQV